MAGLMVIGPLGAINSVYPSAAALATNSAATIDCAPGLFSTITGWLSLDCSRAATMRAIRSLPPPAEYPTTSRIGLLGYCWATAGLHIGRTAHRARSRRFSMVRAYHV